MIRKLISTKIKFHLKAFVSIGLTLILLTLTTACGTTPVTAEERMFRDLSVEFLGEYQLPEKTFENTPIGGLSGITYDRATSRFYAISDDRSNYAPARFYTLNMVLDTPNTGEIALKRVEVEDVTFLKNEQGETFPKGSLDTEGIALSPRRTLFISSEGSPRIGVDPFIAEFNLETGQIIQRLSLPPQFLPNPEADTPQGVQENLGFEALTLSPGGLAPEDPFRLFTATEAALQQDQTPASPEEESERIRFLHYVVNPIGKPMFIAEHLYLLDLVPEGALKYGLPELTALDKEGFLLSLERSFSLIGFDVKLYQIAIANATDISKIQSLAGDISQIQPIQKKLLLNLSDLGIYIDNLEGMTLGPRLPDGSQSLLMVSDNNFNEIQVTQFLLFRLKEN